MGAPVDLRPLYPLVNVITGSPPPSRNGGIWKYVKRALFRELRLRNFMLHAFHFFDFSLSRRRVELWLSKDLKKWILEDGGGRVEDLFVDSGGYKFLSSGIAEKWGFRIDPDTALELQLKMGADRVASLDYPYPPWLPEGEKERRRRLTELGWDRLLGLERPKPYFVIHGHEYGEVRKFALRLREKVGGGELGIAIGSLIPVRKEPWRVLDAVKAAREVFPDAEIHVFGITGSMMPFLIAAGASSFDSKSYMDAAIRWRMIHLEGMRWRYSEASEPQEDSWYHLVQGDGRSAEYARIALHNLQQYSLLLELFEERGDSFIEAFAEANPRAKAYLRALRSHPRSRAAPLPSPDPPRRPEAILVIQCSAQRPYHTSRLYRKVRKALVDAGLRDRIEIAVVSALHGIVRESEFLREDILGYDLRLVEPRKDLVSKVRSQISALPDVLGYVTGRPYREVLREAGVEVLPRRVRYGRSGEALEEGNLRELLEALRTRIGRPRPPSGGARSR